MSGRADDDGDDQYWSRAEHAVDTAHVVGSNSDDGKMKRTMWIVLENLKGDHEAYPSISFDVPRPVSSPFHAVHLNSFPCPQPSSRLSFAFPQTLVLLSDQ